MNLKIKTLILSFSLLISFNTIVQSQNDTIIQDTVFFPLVITNNQGLWIEYDIMPEFPGGENALKNYIISHTIYPPSAIEDRISGTVNLSFVVDTNGSIDKIMFLQGVREDINNECIRVLKEMPKWKPGSTVALAKKGYYRKVIPVYYFMRLNFTLSNIEKNNAINIVPK